MFLLYAVSNCLGGVLLIGLRAVLRQRRVRQSSRCRKLLVQAFRELA